MRGVVTRDLGGWLADYPDPENFLFLFYGPNSKVDFAGVLKRLAAGGFAGGPLVVETLARGDRKATLAEAVKARKLLEKLTGAKA